MKKDNDTGGYVVGPGYTDLTAKAPWGKNKTGMATPDEQVYDERPRTSDRMKASFMGKNPEFQEGAGTGDWTSAKWQPNV